MVDHHRSEFVVWRHLSSSSILEFFPFFLCIFYSFFSRTSKFFFSTVKRLEKLLKSCLVKFPLDGMIYLRAVEFVGDDDTINMIHKFYDGNTMFKMPKCSSNTKMILKLKT